jgi:hypothetical protein
MLRGPELGPELVRVRGRGDSHDAAAAGRAAASSRRQAHADLGQEL